MTHFCMSKFAAVSNFFYSKKKNADPFFKVGVNRMPIRPTRDDMSTGYAISGARLLTLLKVDTMIVTR